MAYDTQSTIDGFFTGAAGNTNTNYRISSGVFQLKNVTDGKYHTVWIEDVSGTPSFKLASTGEE
jgi:hypothetical protein